MSMLQTATPTPTAVVPNNAMAYLCGRWYNAVVRQLSLSAKTFVLQQPFAPLPLTTHGLWAMFNVVPPRSIVHNMLGGGANQLFSGYCAVVNRLVGMTPGDMDEILGEDAPAWNAYVKNVKPVPSVSEIGELFFNWAMIHCPEKAVAGRAEFNSVANDPVNLAIMEMANRAGFVDGVPSFGISLEDARLAVQRAPGGSVTFDSARESGDVSRSWGHGSLIGLPLADRFLTGIDGDHGWQRINEKASQSQVIVDASFENLATVHALPGSWFHTGALSLAYHERGTGSEGRGDTNGNHGGDTGVWRDGAADWEGAFGPAGTLARMVSSLVLVDGVKMRMTSTAQYSPEEQRQIEESFGGGIWPFANLGGHGGLTSKVKFDRDGAAVFSATSRADTPYVLGANVVPVASRLAAPEDVAKRG
jgi:hypothetical protein